MTKLSFFKQSTFLFILVSIVSGCQQTTVDQKISPLDQIEETRIQTPEEAQPLSNRDDLNTLEAELNETVIIEEDFSDL